MALIFVDCEAFGGCPATGQLTEFGAVEYKTRKTFHGIIAPSTPDPANPAVPLPVPKPDPWRELKIATDFYEWLLQFKNLKMVSDNPAYDFMWICDLFYRTLGHNPFGHSARRIGDFYAGLRGDFFCSQSWKNLRITEHTHDPIYDALGNVEAFERLLKGER